MRPWIDRHDPGLTAAHRAVKLAVTATLALAVAMSMSADPQLAVFAAFGCIAILLFADFPGDRGARLSAYLLLAIVGAVLILLGTLASEPGWVAVVSMAVVGFAVTFAGVLSAAVAAATRAALLTFILPVTLPGSISDAPARLIGWGVAVALAVPVAVLVWPPRDHDAVRAGAARACRAIADELTVLTRAGSTALDGEVEEAVAGTMRAVADLRAEFRSASFRPVGLTTGSRLLSRLVDQIDWLRGVASRGVEAGAYQRWSNDAQRLLADCVDVLRSAAATVEDAATARRTDSRAHLDRAITELGRGQREAVEPIHLVAAAVAEVGADRRAVRVEAESPSAVIHELVVTTVMIGQNVAASAAADSRPMLDRLIGRWDVEVGSGPWAAAYDLAFRRVTLHSVWLQNSVRTAVGLALAVWLADLTHVGHSFWVVLGTLSVLRTTAIATGSTALRAFGGTLVGFLLGAGLVVVLGTAPTVLWILLPIALAVAGFAPTAFSFVAGQVAFTVLVVILFNLVDPVGWSVGLVRIEDVAIGCAAGLVCGLLLWPAGAAAQMRKTLADSHRTSADALATSVRAIVASNADARESVGLDLRRATAAAGRLDDAFRSYLADRGSKPDSLHELSVTANGARRVLVAAEAVAAATPLDAVGFGVGDGRPGVLETTEATSSWFREYAAALESRAGDLSARQHVGAERLVLDAVAADPTALQVPRAETDAVTLWEIALHVDCLTRLEGRLTASLAVLASGGRGRSDV